jgi:acyl-CoA thioester hydrolase
MSCHFRTTRRVEFCETDLAGIVHFANFYRYMEQAEHEFFRQHGLKIVGVLPDGTKYGWPRVATSCSFDAPARYEDILEVRLTIARRTVRSLTIAYEFFRDETRLATGEMKTVFCILFPDTGMKSTDMPADFAEKLDRAAGVRTAL